MTKKKKTLKILHYLTPSLLVLLSKGDLVIDQVKAAKRITGS